MNHSKKLKENDVVVFKRRYAFMGCFDIFEGNIGIVKYVCQQESTVRVQVKMNFELHFKNDEIEKIGVL